MAKKPSPDGGEVTAVLTLLASVLSAFFAWRANVNAKKLGAAPRPTRYEENSD